MDKWAAKRGSVYEVPAGFKYFSPLYYSMGEIGIGGKVKNLLASFSKRRHARTTDKDGSFVMAFLCDGNVCRYGGYWLT